MNTKKNRRVRLAIGVVTYRNTGKQLRQLHRSIQLALFRLAPSFRCDAKIFKVDNGRPTLDWAKKFGLRSQTLEPSGNIGFGRAANKLMEAAFESPFEADFIILLNPNGVLHPFGLLEMLRTNWKHPKALIEARHFPEEHPKIYDPKTHETPWVSAACLLIPKIIYKTVGVFDPNIFLYAEDVDFSWRVRNKGFKTLISPRALFGHDVLNPKPSLDVYRSYLLSGRYIAAKWKSRSFKAFCERELIQNGFFSCKSELPEVKVEPVARRGGFSPDFRQAFAFAKTRW